MAYLVGLDAFAAGGLYTVGADLMKYTTLRPTTLYPSATATKGAAWAANKILYGTDDVQNGRRRVQMNPGGSDYWVLFADVAPLIEISPTPAPPSAPAPPAPPAPPSGGGFVITDQTSTAATASPLSETAYRVEKVPGGSLPEEKPFLLREYGGVPVYGWGAIGVGGLALITISLRLLFGHRAVPA